MKYIILILLMIIGLALGIFVGLGGFAGIEWVVFIVLFPLVFIFGTILLSKKDNDEVVEEEKEKSKWDKYE